MWKSQKFSKKSWNIEKNQKIECLCWLSKKNSEADDFEFESTKGQ